MPQPPFEGQIRHPSITLPVEVDVLKVGPKSPPINIQQRLKHHSMIYYHLHVRTKRVNPHPILHRPCIFQIHLPLVYLTQRLQRSVRPSVLPHSQSVTAPISPCVRIVGAPGGHAWFDSSPRESSINATSLKQSSTGKRITTTMWAATNVDFFEHWVVPRLHPRFQPRCTSALTTCRWLHLDMITNPSIWSTYISPLSKLPSVTWLAVRLLFSSLKCASENSTWLKRSKTVWNPALRTWFSIIDFTNSLRPPYICLLPHGIIHRAQQSLPTHMLDMRNLEILEIRNSYALTHEPHIRSTMAKSRHPAYSCHTTKLTRHIFIYPLSTILK